MKTYRGFILMALASVMFCITSLFVRIASVNAFQCAYVRFVFGIVVLCSLWWSGLLRLRVVNRPAWVVRGVCGGAAVWLFFLAIQRIGLAEGTVLSFTYPVFAASTARFWLRERAGIGTWVAIAVALAGVYLVVWPRQWGGPVAIKLLAVLGGALGGVAVAAVRKLRQTDSSHAILLAQCLFGLLIVTVPADRLPYDFERQTWLALMGVGFFATIGQLLMTYSYKLVPATEGSLMGMLTPVLNIAVGSIFFSEVMRTRAWLGALFVLGSCVYVSAASAGRIGLRAATPPCE